MELFKEMSKNFSNELLKEIAKALAKKFSMNLLTDLQKWIEKKMLGEFPNKLLKDI